MGRQSVLAPSAETPTSATVRGWDFNNGCSLDGIMAAMLRTGCQATSLGQAVDEINRMVRDQSTCQRVLRLTSLLTPVIAYVDCRSSHRYMVVPCNH